jgi:hypothetical protein
MSESYQWLILCLNHTNEWWYAWIIPMIIDMAESYQLLIICLNHNNKWWYAWIIPQSLVWFRHIISHWCDSDISSVIGMIQTYYQSMVWFRYIISYWHDSGISSVESFQWLIVCLHHTNDWWYVWIIPMTDNMSESYQWLIFYLNHTNNWWYTWIGMIQA